jgi:large subunit ribosomal protein L53
MLTKYISAVKTRFSPFNAQSGKTVRLFLAMLPPNARSTMAIDVKMLGRAQAAQPANLSISFSM